MPHNIQYLFNEFPDDIKKKIILKFKKLSGINTKENIENYLKDEDNLENIIDRLNKNSFENFAKNVL